MAELLLQNNIVIIERTARATNIIEFTLLVTQYNYLTIGFEKLQYEERN